MVKADLLKNWKPWNSMLRRLFSLFISCGTHDHFSLFGRQVC